MNRIPEAGEFDQTWEIVPLQTPQVYHNCAKCGGKQIFYCSEKFRMNANHKKIDVWLIYKCRECDYTWNCTILSRVNVRSIPADLYAKFKDNDADEAWRYAFKFDMLKKNGVETHPEVEYRVDGGEIDFRDASKEVIRLRVATKFGLPVRVDTLLHKKLGISRTQVEALFGREAITASPAVSGPKGKIRTDTVLSFKREELLKAMGTPPVGSAR
jgi:hypothetical protein